MCRVRSHHREPGLGTHHGRFQITIEDVARDDALATTSGVRAAHVRALLARLEVCLVREDGRGHLACYVWRVMSSVSPAPYVTFEAFLEAEDKSDGRHEWLDGLVYDMSRGTPEHARLSAAIAAELRTSLKGDCVVYGSDAMLYVAETKFSTYADAIVVCGPLATYRVAKLGEAIINPTILVEVLSDSTEKYDRGEKFAHYMRIAPLEAYVLVSQDERRIEVFRRPDRGHWAFEAATAGESVTLHGRALSVDAVYA